MIEKARSIDEFNGQAENSMTPSMMSILINENTSTDGTILDEEEIAAATATLYVGTQDALHEYDGNRISTAYVLSPGGVDTVRP